MGMQLPLEAIRRQIASGVDLMIHLGRLRDKTRRVLEICEVTGYANGEVILNPLFLWNDQIQQLTRVGTMEHTEKLERMKRGED